MLGLSEQEDELEYDPKIRRVLCARLLRLRRDNNLTQAELSNMSGIPQPVLSLYEKKDSVRMPTVNALVKLANALNVSTDYLLGRTEDKQGAQSLISEDSLLSQLSRKDKLIVMRVAEGLLAISVQKQQAMRSSRALKAVPIPETKTPEK